MHRTLLTDKGVHEILHRITTQEFALDTESIGPSLPGKKKGEEGFLNVYRSQLAGISFAFEDNKSFYAPIISTQFDVLSRQNVQKILTALGDTVQPIWMHNAKHDTRVLERERVGIKDPRCTLIQAWLVNRWGIVKSGKGKGKMSYGLKALAERYLGETEAKSFKEVIGQGTWADVSAEVALAYACPDAEWCWRLQKEMGDELYDLGLADWFLDIEMPYMATLRRMEDRGMGLDVEALRAMVRDGRPKVTGLILEWGDKFPGTYIGSRVQVAEALFGTHWPMAAYRETGKGGAALTSSMLQGLSESPEATELGRDAARMKLEYQALTKNLSTYTTSLIEFAECYPDRRVHASFNQTGAATGRLSSNGPNLQNIPVRTEMGKRIMEAFRPAPGHSIVSADFSQIELRVFAHFAGSGAMFDAYQTGTDVHQVTADRINAARQVGKKIIFTVLYGGGAAKVAEDNGLSIARAKDLLAALDAAYPAIPRIKKQAWAAVERRGYVRTISGRIRRLPRTGSRREILSAKRQAFSTVIQGSASDIMKMAALRLEEKGFLHVAQVHDAAYGEHEDRDVEDAKRTLQKEMESAWDLKVPLVAEPTHGKNWLAAK